MNSPAVTTAFEYVGTELELFSKAVHWKAYWGGKVKPYLGERVLEVGAGFGANTKWIVAPHTKRLVCLEPDASLARRLESRIGIDLPAFCESVKGTLPNIPDTDLFNTILYLDVVEHIENDAEELAHAVEHLVPGGHLVILVPAHQALYTPFDKAIGHFRRYNRESLLNVLPKAVTTVFCHYLDSVGLLAALGNRLFLKASMPTSGQLHFWDSTLVPVSRILDPLTAFSLGRSLLGVWEKE